MLFEIYRSLIETKDEVKNWLNEVDDKPDASVKLANSGKKIALTAINTLELGYDLIHGASSVLASIVDFTKLAISDLPEYCRGPNKEETEEQYKEHVNQSYLSLKKGLESAKTNAYEVVKDGIKCANDISNITYHAGEGLYYGVIGTKDAIVHGYNMYCGNEKIQELVTNNSQSNDDVGINNYDYDDDRSNIALSNLAG